MIEELMPESMRLIASHNRASFAQDQKLAVKHCLVRPPNPALGT